VNVAAPTSVPGEPVTVIVKVPGVTVLGTTTNEAVTTPPEIVQLDERMAATEVMAHELSAWLKPEPVT
jgi:hypothetical protein